MKTRDWLAALAVVCACGKGNHGTPGGAGGSGSAGGSAVPIGSAAVGSAMSPGSAEVPPRGSGSKAGSAAAASPRDPARAQAANTRGMQLLAAKNYKGAMAEFAAAIAADDRHVLAHYNLACAASRAQDEEVASRELIWVASAAAWDASAARALKKAYTDPDLEWELHQIPDHVDLGAINRDLTTPLPNRDPPVAAARLKLITTAPGTHDDLCDPSDAHQAGVQGVNVDTDGKRVVEASLRDGVALVDGTTVVTRTDPLGCTVQGASQDQLSELYVSNATDAAPAGLAGRELVVVLYSQGGRRSWTNNIAIFVPKDDTRLAKAHQLARVFDATMASSDDAEAGTVVLTGTGDLVLGPPKAPHKQLFRWNQAAFEFEKLE
jgi:hypothetical protein